MIISSKPLPPPRNSNWEIHIDGATLGANPSAVGSAGLTVWVNGLLYYACTYQKIVATNNSVEFFALLKALKWAREHDMQKVSIFTDSDIVAKWAQGVAQLKDPQMLRLAAGCHHFRQYLSFNVTWVSRQDEKQAFTDYVSKLGLAEECEFKTQSQHKLLLGAYYE